MTNEEAIETIENRFDIMDYCESQKLGEALDIATKTLGQQTEWIPVSKRLPKLTRKPPLDSYMRSEAVFVTYRSEGKNYFCPLPCYYRSNGYWYIDTECIEKEGANFDEYDNGFDMPFSDVIAWMPLPKPYKAESEK